MTYLILSSWWQDFISAIGLLNFLRCTNDAEKYCYIINRHNVSSCKSKNDKIYEAIKLLRMISANFQIRLKVKVISNYKIHEENWAKYFVDF